MEFQETKSEEQNKEKYGYIYITENLINGKKYIGQRSYKADEDIIKRRKEFTYLGSGKLIKSAIKKYGKENFSKIIIDEAYSKEELNEKEKYWIAYYNAVEDSSFYNIMSGGEGVSLGYKYTEETKQKMHKPKSSKGKSKGPQSPEWITKRINAINYNSGRKCTQETRDKISKTKRSKNYHYNIGNKNRLGCKNSEESKQKQREFMLGKQLFLGHNQSDYQKQRMSKARTGAKDSEETRIKKIKAKSTPVQNLRTGEVYLSAGQAEIVISGSKVNGLIKCIKNRKPFKGDYFVFIKDEFSFYTEEERIKFLQDAPYSLPYTHQNYIKVYKNNVSKTIKYEELDNYIKDGWGLK